MSAQARRFSSSSSSGRPSTNGEKLASFQLTHVVETTEHLPAQEAGALRGAWMLRQMRTTADFACGNRLLS